jgi:hypothetical protein
MEERDEAASSAEVDAEAVSVVILKSEPSLPIVE